MYSLAVSEGSNIIDQNSIIELQLVCMIHKGDTLDIPLATTRNKMLYEFIVDVRQQEKEANIISLRRRAREMKDIIKQQQHQKQLQQQMQEEQRQQAQQYYEQQHQRQYQMKEEHLVQQQLDQQHLEQQVEHKYQEQEQQQHYQKQEEQQLYQMTDEQLECQSEQQQVGQEQQQKYQNLSVPAVTVETVPVSCTSSLIALPVTSPVTDVKRSPISVLRGSFEWEQEPYFGGIHDDSCVIADSFANSSSFMMRSLQKNTIGTHYMSIPHTTFY